MKHHGAAAAACCLLTLLVLQTGCLTGDGDCLSIPMDKTKIRFDDGDSFSYGEIPIRVLGMDTPEIRHDEHGFFEDQPFGREAAAETRRIIEAAAKVEWLPCGEDKYQRTLAHVFVDGELLSVKLIRLGLAYETVSFYGDNGFPDLAALILKAAAEGKKPQFKEPYKWRKENRREPKKDG